MNVCHRRRLATLVVALLALSSLALAAQTKGKSAKNANAARPQAKTPAAKSKRAAAAAKAKSSARAGATLFVVAQTGGGSHIEPLVGIIEGRFLEPPSAESEQFAAFAARYYHVGQKYRLLFGGGDAGTATVRGKPDKDSECEKAMASVELQSAARINGLVMGLATNSETLGRRAGTRRFPTPAERTAVNDLASRIFRQKGVAASAVQDMKTINMTATELNGDGKWEIIASFIVRTKARTEAVHHLFLIAAPEANGFDIDLMRYARTTKGDLPEGASLDDVQEALLSEVLVDHVDLDGDKASEVVTMTTNFEGATYKIYHKQKNRWANIYEYYSYRCAY
ncbi:MAG TPA: hypothetical protein VKA60_16165 [Blastocatellia bacterium]|nr:hypothetical protein [Blastocatellia bacterium]